MANTYGLGSVVPVRVVVTVNRTLTDPTNLTLHVRTPSGDENAFTYLASQVTRDSTGHFHYDIDANEVGVWHYQWETAGTAEGGSADYTFMVGETVFE